MTQTTTPSGNKKRLQRRFKQGKPTEPLSSILPPLILGTATFNHQYNFDAFVLPTNRIVHEALSSGHIHAFDTSPYYGPAEILLGEALATSGVQRENYMLITKVGRISASEFDYSEEWIKISIRRSLKRLRTNWLDVVYCHDVEFVSPNEVVDAVRALRKLRDAGVIRYVGISGYPVHVLCELANRVLRETGEPLDAVLSYANYTLQNTVLFTEGIERLRSGAGVDVVLNASPLGMGLLRCAGVPCGSMGDFHPAPRGLRDACFAAAIYTAGRGERLETIALRWALENWARDGAVVGTKALDNELEVGDPMGISPDMGVSVIGVSYVEELVETIRVWKSILEARSGEKEPVRRRNEVHDIAKGAKEVISQWVDYRWDSPGRDYKRIKPQPGRHLDDSERFPGLQSWLERSRRDLSAPESKL